MVKSEWCYCGRQTISDSSMKPQKLLFLLAAMLLIFGCGKDFFRDSTGTQYRLIDLEPTDDFATSVPIRLIVGKETLSYFWGHRRVYSMVPIWTRVFSMDQSISETLTVVSTEFSRPDGELRYTIQSELLCGGDIHQISGFGQRKWSPAYNETRRKVVQQGVTVIAEKALIQLKVCNLDIQ